MALADALKKSRIVVLDIERLKGQASVEFWDLSDFKNRRIRYDDVTVWPRTICVAWKDYGAKQVNFTSEWDDGHEGMIRKVWEVLNDCDAIVGHNIANFDAKKLHGEFMDLKLKPPRPYKMIDTYKIARTQFGFESNTLGALCDRFEIPSKTDVYDPLVAQQAVDGVKAAQKRIKSYNQDDVRASEALYDHFRGWIPNHPHLGPAVDLLICNQCGCEDLTRVSQTHRATLLEYALYQCNNCGGFVRASHVGRVAGTRGTRTATT